MKLCVTDGSSSPVPWIVVLGLLLLFAPPVRAQFADLVTHNGFQACWTTALSQAQFLTQIQSALEGQTFCMAKTTGIIPAGSYSSCAMNACAGGYVGCPVTLHSGAFSGDFTTGILNAPGSADNIIVPVSYTTFGSPSTCTITMSSIAISYSLALGLRPDGNHGLYIASLGQTSTSVNNGYIVSAPDPVCQSLAASITNSIVAQIQSDSSADLLPLLAPETIEQSICPAP
jgi:hypothetical protein